MNTAQEPQNPFIICRAAAGSGKTFTLVKEYLKLAMAMPATVRRDRVKAERQLREQFRSILAITFTNKAACEMKDRVLVSLEAIARHGADRKRSPMGQPLLKSLNAMPSYDGNPMDEEELRWSAEVLHSAIMHQYSDLSVCTIDSFMHRIVRTFAHDLDRPVNFDVMIDQDEIINQAVAQLMSQVGTEGHEPLTRVVQAYADSRMEDEKGYEIKGQLAALAAQFFKEDTEPYVEALADWSFDDFMELHRKLTEESRRFGQQVQRCGVEMMELLERIGIGEEDCNSGSRGFYGFFRGLAKGTIRPLTTTVAKTFESGKFYSGKCSAERRAVLDGAIDELDSIYAQAYSLLGIADSTDPKEGQPLRDHSTRQLLLQNLYAMALLSVIGEQLRRYTRENEVVHLSEFNRMINSIVCNEPAPFIYERLGNRYRHILIDEFQDTSVLQWHNLVPLLENGVSQGEESLVVGDGKQAIYRFRQGDVRQFVDLPRVKGMALHGQTLALPGNSSEMPLVLNRRTASSVVKFNNTFFTWLMGREPYASNVLARQIYIGEPDENGNPALYQYLPDPEPPEGHVGVSFVDAKEPLAVCEEIRRIIVRLVTELGYHQRDIMVLGRTKQDLDKIGTYLQEGEDGMKIEITSNESFFLVRSHAVMAMVAALRLLYDNDDRVAAAELLQRLYNLELTASVHDDDMLERGAVDVARLLREERRGFDFKPDYLVALDLYDCCEELVRELHLDGIDTAYVGALLGRVAMFVTRTHGGIGDFLEWWDDNATADLADRRHRQLSAASPDGVDAVQMLTIHKAKGLEAPVVICPFFPTTRHPSALWVNVDGRYALSDGRVLPAAYVQLSKNTSSHFDAAKNEEQRLVEVDELNVLYVALTRPKEQLYIVCPTPSEKKDTDATSYPALIKAFMDEKKPLLGDPGFIHVESDSDKEEEAPKQVTLHQLSFAEWTTKVKVASRSERILTPLQEASVRFGNYAHDLLSQVRSIGDVDAAVERLAAAETLVDDERERLAELAQSVVTHPASERFFREGYEVKTECDLCDAEGVCRPDRVVVTADETWVIDFKTGQDVGAVHDKQVRRYCRAMEEMGYPKVSGWLLYLLPEVKVRQVV